MFDQRARFVPQTGVEGWLPAAGLIGWEFHGLSEAAEDADDGLARFRVERIDEAGDEELHSGHESILTLNPYGLSKYPENHPNGLRSIFKNLV
jgi:hypothetical protein